MKANEARQYIINEDGEEIDLPPSERAYQMRKEEAKEFYAQVRKEMLERTEEELSELDNISELKEIAEEVGSVLDFIRQATEMAEAGEEGPFVFETPDGPLTIEIRTVDLDAEEDTVELVSEEG